MSASFSSLNDVRRVAPRKVFRFEIRRIAFRCPQNPLKKRNPGTSRCTERQCNRRNVHFSHWRYPCPSPPQYRMGSTIGTCQKNSLLPTCLNLFRIFDLANIGIIFLNFVVLDSFAL